MDKLIIFIVGCFFGKYIIVILDYILDWFASYISLKISFINKQINELSLEQQTDSTDRIGFMVQDIKFYDDELDDLKNNK